MLPPLPNSACVCWVNTLCLRWHPPSPQYNLGFNRQPCTPCDAANGTITTTGPRATSPDECFVPAGHGTTRTDSGGLTGAACPPDTHGSSETTTGLEDVSW